MEGNMGIIKLFAMMAGVTFLATVPALCSDSAPAPAISSGDTGFVLISAALVMLMTPGLALFYGGMVRRKNVLATIVQSFAMLGVVSVQWVLVGYSLAFGPDIGGFIGSLSWAGLDTVGLNPNPDYAATVPHEAFMIFQMMFAVITPALITGAFAERVKFSSFLVFTLIWTTLVYDPIAHWVWGAGGWLKNLGALDFAGGVVVHLSSGFSALTMALLLGKRHSHVSEPFIPHNTTMTLVGAGLLWFGWFGFNAGSALSSGGVATNAFVVTHISGATAALSWMIAEWLRGGKPTALGLASGGIAGLAAITPASGFVTPLSALIIGAVAGSLCYGAVNMKNRLSFDDSLDVFGVHGVGGLWGIIATGLFATIAVNTTGANGYFIGGSKLLHAQFVAILSTVGYSVAATFIIFKVLDKLMGMRVTPEDEYNGLDVTQHGESGYTG
jgi:Amt family ammonium transporter